MSIGDAQERLGLLAFPKRLLVVFDGARGSRSSYQELRYSDLADAPRVGGFCDVAAQKRIVAAATAKQAAAAAATAAEPAELAEPATPMAVSPPRIPLSPLNGISSERRRLGQKHKTPPGGD